MQAIANGRLPERLKVACRAFSDLLGSITAGLRCLHGVTGGKARKVRLTDFQVRGRISAEVEMLS